MSNDLSLQARAPATTSRTTALDQSGVSHNAATANSVDGAKSAKGGGAKKGGGASDAASELGADDLFTPGDGLKLAGDAQVSSPSSAQVAGASFGYNGADSMFADGFQSGGRKLRS